MSDSPIPEHPNRDDEDAAGRPAAPPSRFEFAGDDPILSHPVGREPWFLRFLEGYTLIAMWVGVALLGVALLGATAVYARALYHAIETPFAPSAADVSLVYLAYLLGLGGGLIAVLFSAALVLLAVDAARSLRILVAQGRRRG